MHGLSQAFQETRAAARAAHRQWLRHARGRDRRRPRRAAPCVVRHPGAPVLARAKRKAGVVLGADRGSPLAHARGRARAHARSAQHRHPGLGQSRIRSARCARRFARRLSISTCAGPASGRESPGSDALRRAMRTEVSRKQRRSDGTVTVEGVRFEIPRRVPHAWLQLPAIASYGTCASVDLVDPRSGDHLTTAPADRQGAQRRARSARARSSRRRASPHPPRRYRAAPARALMADYAATGLPPAYLPPTPRRRATRGSMTTSNCSSLCGLKFHPFRPDVPAEALFTTPAVDSFVRRVELGIAPVAASPCSPAIRGRARASPCAFSPSAFAPCPMSWSAPSSVPRAAPPGLLSRGSATCSPSRSPPTTAGAGFPKALRTR